MQARPDGSRPSLTRSWLTLRLRTMTKHYFERDVEDPDEIRMMVNDWWRALNALPFPIVEDAFQQWIDDRKHWPSPAHIREIAQRMYAAELRVQAPRLALVKPPEPERVKVDRETAARIIDEVWNREDHRGFEPAAGAQTFARPSYLDPRSPAYAAAMMAAGRAPEPDQDGGAGQEDSMTAPPAP